MDLNNPEEARKYLKRNVKGLRDSDLGIVTENGHIKTETKKRVTINHVAMAETLTKFINITPGLHPLSRKIMTMKIVNPGMTNIQIGIILALRDHEIEAYETEGKNRVKDYMRVTCVVDGVKHFNNNKGALNEAQRFVEKSIHKDSPLTRL